MYRVCVSRECAYVQRECVRALWQRERVYVCESSGAQIVCMYRECV